MSAYHAFEIAVIALAVALAARHALARLGGRKARSGGACAGCSEGSACEAPRREAPPLR